MSGRSGLRQPSARVNASLEAGLLRGVENVPVVLTKITAANSEGSCRRTGVLGQRGGEAGTGAERGGRHGGRWNGLLSPHGG